MYTKSNLKANKTFLNDANFSESVWCEVRLQGSDHILVGDIYRSPNSTEANNQALNSFIKECKKPSHVIINGDFNHPEINWEHMISTKNDNHKSSKFLEAVMDSFLFQHVDQPTHYRSDQQPTLIDLILTANEAMISNVHTRRMVLV